MSADKKTKDKEMVSGFINEYCKTCGVTSKIKTEIEKPKDNNTTLNKTVKKCKACKSK